MERGGKFPVRDVGDEGSAKGCLTERARKREKTKTPKNYCKLKLLQGVESIDESRNAVMESRDAVMGRSRRDALVGREAKDVVERERKEEGKKKAEGERRKGS